MAGGHQTGTGEKLHAMAGGHQICAKEELHAVAGGGHLDEDVVDEEVGGGWQGAADNIGDDAGVVDDDAELTEGAAAQHGAQKHVPGGPVEEKRANAPVQARQ